MQKATKFLEFFENFESLKHFFARRQQHDIMSASIKTNLFVLRLKVLLLSDFIMDSSRTNDLVKSMI